MITPPSWSSREEALLLVNAYLDGELDAAAVIDVERRMKADPALKAEYERLVELRDSIAAHVPKSAASAELRRRVEFIGAPEVSVEPRVPEQHRAVRSFDWRQLAAAVVLAAGLASGATYLGLRPGAQETNVAALIAGHQRALLALEPYEVASNDRHTVKPWFDSKVALSPRVVDLSSSGYPLVGGRIDTIGGKSVPAVVYKRREHVISVIATPRPGDWSGGQAAARASKDGYSLIGWHSRDFDYAAISDVAEADLEAFVALWRSEEPAK
jgi:anti-sigma factor RsiW